VRRTIVVISGGIAGSFLAVTVPAALPSVLIVGAACALGMLAANALWRD
jgi:hypothetical protein